MACTKDEPKSSSSYSFIFYPRECSKIFVDNAQARTLEVGTEWEHQEYDTISNNTVIASNYILPITTSNTDVVPQVSDYNPIKTPRYELLWDLEDNFTDLPNDDIEQQLSTSYNKAHKVEGEWSPPPLNLDYRTTEIKSINIYSTTALFGLSKGSLLNDFFKMVHPAYIFSAPNQMIYGFEYENTDDITIDKFISYNPIALPSMYLKFASIPQELPIETQFIVEIEIAGGEKLRDTTGVMQLTKTIE